MAGVTESDVMRFFFAMRAERKRGPPSVEQQRLNDVVIARARRELAAREFEDQAERAALERSWDR